MARRRMIDPNIWESEDFNSLSDMERLLFIGMFSLADDEGRGMASSNYLKVKIFPYDNRNIDEIEQGIIHISEAMSVTLYMNGDKRYYQMDHWHGWQTISRPTPSKIPSPEHEDSLIIHGVLNEDSTSTHGVFNDDSIPSEVNIKEKKINISEVKVKGDMECKKENGVTLHDITEYGFSQGVPGKVCEKFFSFNQERGWMFHGEPMKDWRTALLAWNRKEKTLTNHNYAEHEPTDIKVNMVDLDAED